MKYLRYLLLMLLFGFIVIQFFPPARNQSGDVISSEDVTMLYSMPDEVRTILKNSCYDCHSNTTRYPWYVKIQPVGWFMAGHIKHGKEELNFNEFGAYSAKRRRNKLKRMKEQVEEDKMPLKSYTLMHADAKLSEHQKSTLIKWIDSVTIK
jgi:hypothetical protein